MNTILLFGMPGGAELFFIILIVVMLFGSKKIPELARGLGKGISEIKNATGEIQREITEGARDLNSLKDQVNVEKQVKDLIKGDKKETVEESETERNVAAAETEDIGTENSSHKTQPPTPKSVSQTVYRRSPYASEEPENNSVEE